MKYTTTIATLSALASASSLISRQDNGEEEYIRSVCFPDQTDPVPPCQAIINIESACQPNGTASADYLAHQQCMCNGGFFSNWNGCQQCQYVHGSRSEAVVEAFESIISSASVQLCTGTPTAVFADIFSSISDSAVQTVAGAATVTSDRYPSQAAVSLYYTASGNQGPGAITGAAASATKSAGEEVSSSAAAASAAITGSASSVVTLTGSSTGSSTSGGAGASQSGSSSRSGTSTMRSQSSSASATASASASSTGAAGIVTAGQGGVLAAMAGALMLL